MKNEIEFKRNKETGALESWKNDEKVGEVISIPGDFNSFQEADEYLRYHDIEELHKIWSIEDIRDFFNKELWTFARTYADRAPHEYIVRDKIVGTDDDFMRAVNFIQNNGITMYFWDRPNKYIFVDDYQYWVMRDSDDDPTTVLNRCKIREYKYTITWKGKDK